MDSHKNRFFEAVLMVVKDKVLASVGIRNSVGTVDNPRTFTGEDSLENLSRLRDGVVSGDATTITTLKQRMLWRRSGGDTESHA